MFGAEEEMFLGHTISKDIIQACGEKAQAIINMPSPRTLKDMQSQNEKLASLSRFLSKATEKSLLFFKTLKRSIKRSNFAWTEEAEKALKETKKHMTYRTKTSIRGQVLADFLAEVPFEKASLAEELVEELTKGAANIWKLFTDSSSNDGGSGIGLILTSPKGIELNCVLRFEFNASNNEAEYEA
ncbi:reverse transcriptase domain-containing protein [Tanacetum coccineum]